MAFFNLAFLMIFFIFSGYITGNLVLESKITPGETFESEFRIDNLKEATLIFETSSAIWDSYPLYEVLNITVLDPKGDVVFYQLKEISLSTTDPDRQNDQEALIESSTDTTCAVIPTILIAQHLHDIFISYLAGL